MTPRTNVMIVRKTEAAAITLKNRHSMKVHRKVGAANIAAQPIVYPKDKTRKTNIGILYSRRTDIQPYMRP